ncbi:MAG TPA: hypothetical protein VL197_05785 [Nitrospirota bacterium]|nr:hypothetical protein [Nitrospirota bacterium]
MSNEKTRASEEQLIYANILNIGMWLGLAVLTITFLMYAFGVLPNFVPINDLPNYWGMKAKDYIHTMHAPTGWGWLSLVGKGDYLNFVGIAMLAGLTILCYLSIMPTLTRKKDTAYLVIAIVEVAVLVLAASGIMKTGGH